MNDQSNAVAHLITDLVVQLVSADENCDDEDIKDSHEILKKLRDEIGQDKNVHVIIKDEINSILIYESLDVGYITLACISEIFRDLLTDEFSKDTLTLTVPTTKHATFLKTILEQADGRSTECINDLGILADIMKKFQLIILMKGFLKYYLHTHFTLKNIDIINDLYFQVYGIDLWKSAHYWWFVIYRNIRYGRHNPVETFEQITENCSIDIIEYLITSYYAAYHDWDSFLVYSWWQKHTDRIQDIKEKLVPKLLTHRLSTCCRTWWLSMLYTYDHSILLIELTSTTPIPSTSITQQRNIIYDISDHSDHEASSSSECTNVNIAISYDQTQNEIVVSKKAHVLNDVMKHTFHEVIRVVGYILIKEKKPILEDEPPYTTYNGKFHIVKVDEVFSYMAPNEIRFCVPAEFSERPYTLMTAIEIL